MQPELQQPLLDPGGRDPPGEESDEHKKLRRRMRFAMAASLVANVLLLASKIVAYALSHSKAVLASAADSFVDIASQARPPCTDPYDHPAAGQCLCAATASTWSRRES